MEIDEQQEPGEENEQAPAQVLQQDVEIVINQEAVDGEGSDDGGEDSGEENFQQVQGIPLKHWFKLFYKRLVIVLAQICLQLTP